MRKVNQRAPTLNYISKPTLIMTATYVLTHNGHIRSKVERYPLLDSALNLNPKSVSAPH